jgi:single-strand DNA-binding protein
VIATGRLRQRSYEAQDGDKRTVYELHVDEAGPALSRATAKVARSSRSGNGRPAAAA